MRYLTLSEILQMYRFMKESSDGTFGILSLHALESAIAQPRATFDGRELYPTIVDKAAAFGYSLIMNHAFVDGNKRIGHAAGKLARNEFVSWVSEHIESIG